MSSIRELIQRGKKSFENKQYTSAENYFRKVLQANNNFADIHNLLGIIHHNNGNFENAISCFKKALQINPNYTEAILNLAVLYNDLGQYKEAKTLYEKLKKNGNGPAVKGKSPIEPVLRGKLSNMHMTVGDLYASTGLYKEAADEYQKALDLNPTYADIRTKLGVALRELGKMTESAKELKQVVKEKPNFLSALIHLGVTCYSMDNKKEAKEVWKKVLKVDPKNEAVQAYLKLV